MVHEAKVPPSVVMALDLDDKGVLEEFHTQGIDFADDGAQTWVAVSSRRAALAFIEELEYRATSEWDSPFGVRMAMGKVAKRLRQEWGALLAGR